MAKIGVVLSGCAGKGAYEIGCFQAIVEHFGKDNITCVSTASVGSFIAQMYGMGKEDELKQIFRDIDNGEYGRHMFGMSTNPKAVHTVQTILADARRPDYEHYVSVWNVTHKRVEYVPFHALNAEQLPQYMQAAISIPVFSKGIEVDGCVYLDGAMLDNIPVSPLLEKDLDYIFCVYFDNGRYVFETPEFDRKIIKLYDFPNQDRLASMFYKFGTYNQMYEYGYDYAGRVIEQLFKQTDPESVYEAIFAYNDCANVNYKPRLTADVVVHNVNALAKRYSNGTFCRERHMK